MCALSEQFEQLISDRILYKSLATTFSKEFLAQQSAVSSKLKRFTDDVE